VFGLFGGRKKQNDWDKRKKILIDQLAGNAGEAVETIDEVLEELEREYYATGFEVEAYETILQEKERELELNPNPRLEDEVNRLLLEAERTNERFVYLGNLIDAFRDIKMAVLMARDRTKTHVIISKGNLVKKLRTIKETLPRILAGEDLKDLEILAEVIKKECQVEERRHTRKRTVKTKLGERIERVRKLLREVKSENDENEEVQSS
jgi:hypothetical protein